MNFQFNNKKIDNPIAKLILFILALFVVVAVLGLVGFILVPVVLFVVVILFFVALIVPIAAMFGGRNWQKGIKGSGESLTEIRDVNEFTGISLGLACEVEIEPSDEQEVTIETDDNILGYILSYVQEGILHINTKNNLSPSKKIIIKIKTNNLSKLIISGSSKVQIKDIAEEKLFLKVSGAAKIAGNGKANQLDIVISGAGKIDFKEVITEKTTLKISGSGRVDLFVEDSIDVTINGAGKVNVWGKPANVNKGINGLGKVNLH